MSNVPNLDAMETDELMEFWKKHQLGWEYKALFPSVHQGKKRVTADLANYASNLATARACRLAGKVIEAQAYDRICDKIYAGLPSWALW